MPSARSTPTAPSWEEPNSSVVQAGTSRTYAYLLVDHLRWLDAEALSIKTVTFADVERYMGAVGAEFAGPFGQPWRPGKRPYGQSALEVAAAALKGFYVHLGKRGINPSLNKALDLERLPTTADRRRALLGHPLRSMPANPWHPRRPYAAVTPRCSRKGPDPSSAAPSTRRTTA